MRQTEHDQGGANYAHRQMNIEIYDRLRDLPSLIGAWPEELRDSTLAGTRTIVCRLQAALRSERERGRSGHWSYDLERHLNLARAYKAEFSALEAICSSENASKKRAVSDPA